MRARENKLPLTEVSFHINALTKASQALDREETRAILMRAVSEYTPRNGVEDLVSVARAAVANDCQSAVIVDMRNHEPK